MSELAAEIKISKQQLTPIIDRLIENSLVSRKTGEDDRRIVRIEITELGRKTLQEIRIGIKNSFTAKLSEIPNQELDELMLILIRMQEILQIVK
jgi:DNA-binding MarR family transcriptional regulator